MDMGISRKNISQICCLLCASFILFTDVALAQTKKSNAPTQASTNTTKPKNGLESTAIRKVEPEYPPIAKAARASGNVEVEVQIDENGNVVSAKPISGHPLLRAAAEAAAQQWKFKPAKLGETRVKVEGVLTFNFALDKTDPKTKRAAKADPAEELCDQAYKLSQEGRYEEAIVKFQASLRRKPDYAWALYNLGMAYVKVERYADAESSCANALKIRTAELKLEGDGEQDMIYEDSMICLGIVESLTGRYDEAIGHFRKVSELEKKMFDVRVYLGMTLNAKGDNEAAILALKESIAIKPSDTALYLLGDSYQKLGQFKEAVDVYQQCLKLTSGPLQVMSLHGLGIASLRLGDRQAAMNAYQSLKKLNSNRLAEELMTEINK